MPILFQLSKREWKVSDFSKDMLAEYTRNMDKPFHLLSKFIFTINRKEELTYQLCF